MNQEIQELAYAVFSGAEACEEHKTGIPWSDLDGRAIAAYMDYEDGSSGVAIFALADGRFCVVRQWEDTTGHGCQCGGEAAIYASREEALLQGINGDEAIQLGLAEEREGLRP